MMFSEPSFIALNFDESEADLWLALQRIEPVNRSAFIKATLRQVLDIPPIDTAKKNYEHEQTKNHVDTLEKEIESFTFEALFTGTSEPDAEYEGFLELEKTKHNSLSEPWDYLFNTVIGEEKDLVVINAILQAVHSSEEQDDQSDSIHRKMNSSEFQADEVGEADEPDGRLDMVRDQTFEIDFESLKVDLPKSFTGFEYLMKHIIGTEEDEAVLNVLRGGPEEKFKIQSPIVSE